MENPRTDESLQSLTATYHPTAGAEVRPAAEIVAGSTSDHELAPLLHMRLRFLVLVFIVFSAAVILVRVPSGLDWLPQSTRISITETWAHAVSLVALLGLLALLSSRRSLTLRQLRVVELILFAILAGRVIQRGYVLFWDRDHIDRALAWIAAGDFDSAFQMLSGLVHRLLMSSSMYVVAYGVIIPNTWRRCALVVAAFVVLSIAVWVVACIDRGLPVGYWFTFGFTIPTLIFILIAVMSVYGTYRIESSRQEAAEARRLGQYVLREKIGGGGMGEVHLADHVLLRRPCAIKLIRPERAGDPGMLQRFEREVRATASLTHPNTVQVFDYGHTPDGAFYYVMEYLPGITLEQLVRQYGPLPPERAIHFLRQLCGALAEAHAVGLIHRDIKPGNVIVCERGGLHDVAKLLDFGLVLAQGLGKDGERLTQEGVIAGTPAYVSPEQASGREDLDARNDIYSMGCLAYFLLTGKPPFGGRSAVPMLAAHMYEPPTLPTTHRSDLPADLEQVVLRCLAKNPAERFASVLDLESALTGCLTSNRWTDVEAACWWRVNCVAATTRTLAVD